MMHKYNTRSTTKAKHESTPKAVASVKTQKKRRQNGDDKDGAQAQLDLPTTKKARVFHGLEPNSADSQNQVVDTVGPKASHAATVVQKTEIDAAKSLDKIDLLHPTQDGEASSQPIKQGDEPPATTTKKQKKGSHKGFTPDESPFPEWEGPANSACQEVFRLLDKHHEGEVKHKQPERIPAPSLDVAGCGEVESVLDALLRTYLSGATTMKNANQAIQGLYQKFGKVTEGLGKGSIDWNEVRLASHADLMGAIQSAGLGKIKSGHIKEILDLVQQENLTRVEELLGERLNGIKPDIPGAATEPPAEKDKEIKRIEHSVLSLEHLRSMTKNEAITEMVKFKGIGVKTAACVTLFCLRMPCFAVDTHVHRFCKWLGWVPPKATEIQTFNHCELHVPEDIKYALHQLFIIHGQECHRCKANTLGGTKEWNECVCPLEHLLERGKPQSVKVKVEAGMAPITNFFPLKDRTASGSEEQPQTEAGDDQASSDATSSTQGPSD